MTNDLLRGVVERPGLEGVVSVLSSGNLVFRGADEPLHGPDIHPHRHVPPEPHPAARVLLAVIDTGWLGRCRREVRSAAARASRRR
jgi:hypothetical protein